MLFIGLPCVVGALYHFLGTRPENLLTCELICNGPTDLQIHKEYITYLEKKYSSKVTEFSVRHKKYEWRPGYLYAKFENGEEFEKPFYETEYGFAFTVFGKEACYNCRFKGSNHCADIMIGDFWGANEADEFWNRKGVSVIFAQTEKGDVALQALSGVKLFLTSIEKAIAANPMIIKSKEKSRYRERFVRLRAKRGLIYAASHTLGFLHPLKRAVSRVLPLKLVLKAKRLIYSVRG